MEGAGDNGVFSGYIRSIRMAVETADQRVVARALGVSQPAISKLLTQAEARE
ncbi:hypothetical protein [Arthrobacter sp. NA-172]|uniref:hypothetical protein n=1 Tax=Arthrobacter sp. NA-172 TaxID=3367524 RepID=UPI0037551FB5